MQSTSPTSHNNPHDDEIDLIELAKVIWQGKWLIIAVTFVFAVGSVIYALSQPNIYKSEALLAPAESGGSASRFGQLGGLASLAGVNLKGGAEEDKIGLALEILKSREFISYFVNKYELKPDIMAVDKWHAEANRISYNKDSYDKATNTWVREVDFPKQPEPSMQEVHEVFISMLSASRDDKNNMVKIAIEHQSPYVAAEWVRLLVQEINEHMREREQEEASRSIAYLENQLEKTSLAEAQNMLYSLIEEQTKTLMLANVREEYVLKTIDPAVVPERKAGPKRALICIVGTLLGGMLSVFGVLVLSAVRKYRAEQVTLN